MRIASRDVEGLAPHRVRGLQLFRRPAIIALRPHPSPRSGGRSLRLPQPMALDFCDSPLYHSKTTMAAMVGRRAVIEWTVSKKQSPVVVHFAIHKLPVGPAVVEDRRVVVRGDALLHQLATLRGFVAPRAEEGDHLRCAGGYVRHRPGDTSGGNKSNAAPQRQRRSQRATTGLPENGGQAQSRGSPSAILSSQNTVYDGVGKSHGSTAGATQRCPTTRHSACFGPSKTL